MIKTTLEKKSPLKILCLGAHCDDIEIGCGGSILKVTRESKNVHVIWVVFSSDESRKKEAISSAEAFLRDAKKKEVVVLQFRNGFFPYCGGEIKEYFESLKQIYSPDVIFTHFRKDLHQDHRVINELTWNTFRDHMILEYEIVKYDADLGSPNYYISLEEDICNRKTECVMRNFTSQSGKKWFTEDTFKSIMRIRGVESNSPTKYAEGFYCRKILT